METFSVSNTTKIQTSYWVCGSETVKEEVSFPSSFLKPICTAHVTVWCREREWLWSWNRVPNPALPSPTSDTDKLLTPQPRIPQSRTALALSRCSTNSSFSPFSKYSLNKFNCLVSPCAISFAFPYQPNIKLLLIATYQSNESRQNLNDES